MPKLDNISPADEGRALLCFPLVGLLIGLLLLGAALVALPLFNNPVTSALLLAFWAAITGALHLDGLADSADGWLGGYGDTERTLEIMRDPRCGSSALVTVICLLLIKFAALTVIVDHHLWAALVVAPIIGRCTGPLLFVKGKLFYAPYVQPSGIAKNFIDHCPPYARLVSYVAILGCGLLLGPPPLALSIIAACAVMMLLIRQLSVQRLNGVTGDVAGAATEILETTLLLGSGMLLV